MGTQVRARVSPTDGVPPAWTSLLAVIAHPDHESSGLGAVLDAFILAGTRVEMICLTHGQVWRLDDAPGDLAALRGAEMAAAIDVLVPDSAAVRGHPGRKVDDLCQSELADDVVSAADSCHPDGLLVFDVSDASEVTGPVDHLDHLAATSAGLLAAQILDLPVLGWNLSQTVAVRLSRELGVSMQNRPDEEVDLRVTFERARQRMASRRSAGGTRTSGGSRRRLEVLADSESLRWLRPPHTVAARRRTHHPVMA